MKQREHPHSRGGSRVGAVMGDGERAHTLIYDGECRICRRSIEWIRGADREGRIAPVPYQDPAVRARFPDVPLTEMEAAMQLISREGRRWEGADAGERVLELLPGWRALAPLFRIPGVRRLARLVYRAVARNRRRLGCGEHCRVAPPHDGAGRATERDAREGSGTGAEDVGAGPQIDIERAHG